MDRSPGDDQTRADLHLTSANLDQPCSDRDRTASDREPHGRSRDARDRTGQTRRETAASRYETAQAREASARERDLAALERDRAADERDRQADERDAEVARLARGLGTERATTGAQIILHAARDRKRAAGDRERAAVHRAEAERDRQDAARDRQLAADDRAHAAAEREAAAIDMLTGAWRRGPGLSALQREFDRARRGTGQLVVAYVDVDGLKAINDSRGHSAGDAVLRRTVRALQTQLRSYELIVRLGGDEFLCALSGATIVSARRRFTEIASELAARRDGASVTVGFAALASGDTPTELIDRADRDLLTTRARRRLAPVPTRD